ncbi:hypothetical protein Tco_1392534 [Tanacetum coccineum]
MGFGSIAGGLDHVNPVIRLPIEHGISRGSMEMKPDIKNMTINEYLEYEVAKKRQLWVNEEDGDDGDIFDMLDITVKDVERIRQFLTPNVPDVMEDVIQPLILKTIHTTPTDENYVASATNSILDKLLEEFGDELLNVTMVDEELILNPLRI